MDFAGPNFSKYSYAFCMVNIKVITNPILKAYLLLQQN